MDWPGTWTYSDARCQAGDNSNTQYAAAGPERRQRGRASPSSPRSGPCTCLLRTRPRIATAAGPTRPGHSNSTASMTCAGISSLIISRLRARYQGRSSSRARRSSNCGKGGVNRGLQPGSIGWPATSRWARTSVHGQQWKYLLSLRHSSGPAGSPGVRFFGQNDWYRMGAEELVHEQNKLSGFWRGRIDRGDELLATSFALLFLAKGRAPVLINKLRHLPSRRLEQRSRRHPQHRRRRRSRLEDLLTWQVVDPTIATIQDLLQAPIVFFNGHRTPEFSAIARQNLREFVEQGGFLFADACCSDREFDRGFRRLDQGDLPRGGIRAPAALAGASRSGGPSTCCLRTSTRSGGSSTAAAPWSSTRPTDLSCYWNQIGAQPDQPRGHQGDQGRPERHRLRHRPRDARRQAGRSATCTTSRPKTRPSGALCGSPSSCTPATGTSPPRPSPT